MAKKNQHGSSQEPERNSNPSKLCWQMLSPGSQFSVVWHLFKQGKSATAISKIIREEYGAPTSFTRQKVSSLIQAEAQADRLRFVPKPSTTQEHLLRTHFPWLNEISISQTTRFEDVARKGADMLITSLKQLPWINKKEVHLGFAGGHAMHLLVQTFARMLSETNDKLPKKLVLHALVAGFDVLEPTTDPNTFFTLFQDRTKFSTEFSFVGLQTPPRVQADQYDTLRESDWFQDSYKHAKDLDILVTSAANWRDKDSTFRKSMKRSPNSYKMLNKARCAGDMFWLPIGPNGPLQVKTEIRSMTLLELNEVADCIDNGKHVYLVLGPCAGCDKLKSEVLSAILKSKRKLISHLVSDTGTVREVLKKLPAKPA
jgi:DNA-binding transcriptional regulator LsrR (DeoR family)